MRTDAITEFAGYDELAQLGDTVGETVSNTVAATNAWIQAQADMMPGQTDQTGGTVGGGWPAAVPIRPGQWDLDTQSYKVFSGDTVAGLAATYLGDPQRWSEIWLAQPATARQGRNAGDIYPGEWFYMPDDAVATLRAAVGLPPSGPGEAATAPPGGYNVVGSTKGTDVEAEQRKAMMVKAGIAAAVVGGAALLYYAMK